MIVVNLKEKTLQKDQYVKTFSDAKDIDDLLSKIKIKDDIKIIVNGQLLYDSLKNDPRYNKYQIEIQQEGSLPLFDENIDIDNLDYIRLKKYQPKKEWQQEFGKEVYITNDHRTKVKMVEGNIFCFDKEDLQILKKNNWHIDDAYMIRVFFDGKEI